MRKLLNSKRLIQNLQMILVRVRDRSSPGSFSKIDYRLHMDGLRIDQPLPELRRFLLYAITHRREGSWIGVLSRELPELIVGIDESQCVLSDEVHLVPQLVEFRRLSLVQHQPLQVIVFTVVQRQSHDFIDRYNLRIAECRREQVAKFLELSQQSLFRGTVVSDENRSLVTDRFIAVRPRRLAVFRRG